MSTRSAIALEMTKGLLAGRIGVDTPGGECWADPSSFAARADELAVAHIKHHRLRDYDQALALLGALSIRIAELRIPYSPRLNDESRARNSALDDVKSAIESIAQALTK